MLTMIGFWCSNVLGLFDLVNDMNVLLYIELKNTTSIPFKLYDCCSPVYVLKCLVNIFSNVFFISSSS